MLSVCSNSFANEWHHAPPLKEWATQPRDSVVRVACGRRDRIATARGLGRLVGARRHSRGFRLYSCICTLAAQRWRSFVRLLSLFPLSYVSSSFLRSLGRIVPLLSRSFHRRSCVIVRIVKPHCADRVHFVIGCAVHIRSVRRMFLFRVIASSVRSSFVIFRAVRSLEVR